MVGQIELIVKFVKTTTMNKRTLLLPVVALSLFFTSCIKNNVTDLTTQGSTFIKISSNRNNSIFFSPFTDVKMVPLVNVRKDANTNESLQKLSEVTITGVPGMVDRYNADNGTNFEQLPDSLYTLDPSVSKSGNIYTITFNPGDFSFDFPIHLDGSKWDLSRKYALGFALTDPGTGNKISNGLDSVIALISIKNAYDGTYRYDMCTYHPSGNPNYDCGTTEVELHTTSNYSCKVYWPLGGDYGGPMVYGGGLSWFGAQEPEYTVNPATNKVTVQNAYIGATTFYTTITAASGFDTRYEPSEKKFYIRYGYNYDPGPVFNPANTREWTLELTYLGPR